MPLRITLIEMQVQVKTTSRDDFKDACVKKQTNNGKVTLVNVHILLKSGSFAVTAHFVSIKL